MFFIHLFTFVGSSVLLAMAFDRFVAISNPLRYDNILTHAKIAQIGVAVIIRGTVILTPLVLLLKRLSFCRSHVLHHSYCFHPDVRKLSRSDTKTNSAFGLTAIISTAGVDSFFILLSYVLIIRWVLNSASPGRGGRPSAPAFLTSLLWPHSIFPWSACLLFTDLENISHLLCPPSLQICTCSFHLWWIPLSTVWRQSRFRKLCLNLYVLKALIVNNS